ncbi:restriction endonuclease subunit S [Hymenobacter armeniacus]|uniref:Restriction endonuclease subunit S n=1 Tax=Hymenobacter armeniacus TaxID=2771358 RepID=A0ABR8JUW6_9BACT|nr:restriction endonuclease subunit S [Hymenobacter armeniacus]MBD2722581.1 restriction endonuclease subunit S [Hymenobacter armeniacus]
MNYPSYQETRETGLPWVPVVPSHWKIKRLQFLATCNDDVLPEDTNPLQEVEYVDISSVNLIDGITATDKFIFDVAPSRARRRVQNGDTIVSTVRTYLKAVATIKNPPENLIVSTGFAVIRPGEELAPEFLGYFCKSEFFVSQVVAVSTGVSYPATNASDIMSLPMMYPSIAEQNLISVFLDEKTAHIDALLTRQKCLLALLTEKRTALITQAVTQGLNANAPKRQSEVAWLGEVPAHWEEKRLRYLNKKVKTGGTPSSDGPDYFENEGVSWYTPGDFDGALPLKPGAKKLSTAAFASGDAVLFPADSVMLVGIGATLGKVSVSENSCSANQQINAVVPIAELSSYFLAYFLIASNSEIKLMSNASTIGILNQEKTKQLTILLPPKQEQEAIVQFLQVADRQITKARETAVQTIKWLREYRTALITAAVTGQIDVRAAVTAEAA